MQMALFITPPFALFYSVIAYVFRKKIMLKDPKAKSAPADVIGNAVRPPV
jgi:hypothetical protein